MGKIIGIDLGTGFSAVALRDGQTTKVIVNPDGDRLTPSIVAFDQQGNRMVGRAAKNQAAINPTRTISAAKRLMGKLRRECVEDEKHMPFKLHGEPDDPVKIDIDGQLYLPQQIGAMVLSELRKGAEAAIGTSVTQCVISVPAYWGDAGRQATKDAGALAGMEVLRIVSEPTAAALAYGLDQTKNQTILITDPGSGTADNTIVKLSDGLFEVAATSGDTHLGGLDFDRALADWVADEFKKECGVDIRNDHVALARLMEACENAKCDLSTVLQVNINIPYITAVAGAPKHLSITLSRATFEKICEPLFERLRKPIIQVLADAKMQPSQIDTIVLCGGSSRLLKFQEIVSSIFPGKVLNKSINPDEAVAIGCANMAAVLGGELTDLVLIDVTPLSLCLETQGGIATVLIPRNSAIPIQKSEVFSTAADNQPAVDVHVLQGERKLASGNRTLGRFQLTGIPPAPRGAPQIEITFNIDVNGIVHVAAKDKATGKAQNIEIKSSGGLGKDEIARMMAEAQSYDAEDSEKAATIEARNSADNLVYYALKFMRENTKAISAATHEGVKVAIDALKEVLHRYAPKPEIVSAIDAAEIALKRMQEEAFKMSGQQAAPQTQPPKPAMPKVDVGMPEEAL